MEASWVLGEAPRELEELRVGLGFLEAVVVGMGHLANRLEELARVDMA